jgi:hypothetical protein
VLQRNKFIPAIPRLSTGQVRELHARRMEMDTPYVAIEITSTRSMLLNPIKKTNELHRSKK